MMQNCANYWCPVHFLAFGTLLCCKCSPGNCTRQISPLHPVLNFGPFENVDSFAKHQEKQAQWDPYPHIAESSHLEIQFFSVVNGDFRFKSAKRVQLCAETQDNIHFPRRHVICRLQCKLQHLSLNLHWVSAKIVGNGCLHHIFSSLTPSRPQAFRRHFANPAVI